MDKIASAVCDSPACVSLSNVFIQMVLKNTDNILSALKSCDNQLWILKKSSTETGQKCNDKEHQSGFTQESVEQSVFKEFTGLGR